LGGEQARQVGAGVGFGEDEDLVAGPDDEAEMRHVAHRGQARTRRVEPVNQASTGHLRAA
jgi:hypothetical protein